MKGTTMMIFLPLLGAFLLYLWSVTTDRKNHTKHVSSGYKSWQTRKTVGHYLKIYDSYTDSYKLAWINN